RTACSANGGLAVGILVRGDGRRLVARGGVDGVARSAAGGRGARKLVQGGGAPFPGGEPLFGRPCGGHGGYPPRGLCDRRLAIRFFVQWRLCPAILLRMAERPADLSVQRHNL